MFEGLQMSLGHVVTESYIVLTLEEHKYELWMILSDPYSIFVIVDKSMSLQ